MIFEIIERIYSGGGNLNYTRQNLCFLFFLKYLHPEGREKQKGEK